MVQNWDRGEKLSYRDPSHATRVHRSPGRPAALPFVECAGLTLGEHLATLALLVLWTANASLYGLSLRCKGSAAPLARPWVPEVSTHS